MAGGYDVYDVRAANPDPYPPKLEPILQSRSCMKKIGAESTWTMSNSAVYANMQAGGDWMLDSGPQISSVIDAGVRVHILCGDADFILNFKGVEAQVSHWQSSVQSLYNSQKLAAWTVDGQPAGLYINAKQLSYTRVYGAGHEVPAYGNGNLAVGRAALVMFEQVLAGGPITNT